MDDHRMAKENLKSHAYKSRKRTYTQDKIVVSCAGVSENSNGNKQETLRGLALETETHIGRYGKEEKEEGEGEGFSNSVLTEKMQFQKIIHRQNKNVSSCKVLIKCANVARLIKHFKENSGSRKSKYCNTGKNKYVDRQTLDELRR